jgi:hypothetical protein
MLWPTSAAAAAAGAAAGSYVIHVDQEVVPLARHAMPASAVNSSYICCMACNGIGAARAVATALDAIADERYQTVTLLQQAYKHA